MKRNLKFVALISIVTIALTIFAGCNNTKKEIVLGTNPEFPPFEFVTEQGKGLVGEFDGVDVAVSLEIAKGLGQQLKVENMEFDSLIPALGTGKIDFIAAGMTITDERKKNVDFSDPYYTAIQNMIVPENSTIKSAADLDGKRVGVVLGYTGDFAVTDMVDKEGKKITITRMNKGTDIILELLNGKIDAVVIDSPPAKEFVIKNKGLKIVEDNAVFSGEEYGIAVKKGNADLLAKINKVIKDLKDSGKVDELVKTYSTK